MFVHSLVQVYPQRLVPFSTKWIRENECRN